MTEEELAAEEELLEVAKHLAAAPAEDVVANHCYGLFELAALHLSQQPPQLDKARLAIDALGLLVDGLGERLGQHAAALADGLSQLRLAFVRISSATPSSDGHRAPRPRSDRLSGQAHELEELGPAPVAWQAPSPDRPVPRAAGVASATARANDGPLQQLDVVVGVADREHAAAVEPPVGAVLQRLQPTC